MENLNLGELFVRAEQWLAHDPDPETSEELRGLLGRARQGGATDAAAATAELADRFDGRLKFGTAGLRAEVGAGPKRMNRVVVTQTSAGFAQFLLRRADRGEAKTPLRVVIGFDARKNSDVFARDAAEVFAGYGLTPVVLPGPLPTPVTAFAVRYFEAAAGVMVTASHNPPRDNGYKVYLGDGDSGSQIIPPDDSEIAALIAEVASVPVGDIPRAQVPSPVDAEVVSAYVAATRGAVQATRQALQVGDVSAAELSVVYTAMHGVGATVTEQVFAAAKLPRLHGVTEQHTPDGSFPTVAFPNPEEPGALDLAYETARQLQADVVIAHDPDADRLAVALPDRDSGADTASVPKYTALTGNQLGLLLGWRMATAEAARIAPAAQAATQSAAQPALACTIVSSPALGAVAEHFGFNYQETLSGFKWVSRVPGLAFGFEEALGYLVHPRVVHDKDGISAAAELIAWAEELKHSGKTLWDALAEIHETIGYFASAQITVRLDSTAAVEALAERLRAVSPTSFGAVAVHRTQDLSVPGTAPVPANVLRYDLVDGSRVMVRPSGTEPKLKLYLDTSSREGDIAARTATAEARLEQLTASVEQLLKDLSTS